MLGDMLYEIKDAEDRAEKTIEAARVRAAQIELEATEQIQKINAKNEDEVAKIAFKKTYQKPDFENTEYVKLDILQEKINAAKNFIIDEFYKRYQK